MEKDNYIESALNDLKQLISTDSLNNLSKCAANSIDSVSRVGEGKEAVSRNNTTSRSERLHSRFCETDKEENKKVGEVFNGCQYNSRVDSKRNMSEERLGEILTSSSLESLVREVLKEELRQWMAVNLVPIIKNAVNQSICRLIEQSLPNDSKKEL